jgi:hypothetical protein
MAGFEFAVTRTRFTATSSTCYGSGAGNIGCARDRSGCHSEDKRRHLKWPRRFSHRKAGRKIPQP